MMSPIRYFFLISTMFFFTNVSYAQTINGIIFGELTIDRTYVENLKIGDTLILQNAKKIHTGSIRLENDSCIYEWSICYLNQKKYNWCKIGTWSTSDKIEFIINCTIISFLNITQDKNKYEQTLIVTEIKH